MNAEPSAYDDEARSAFSWPTRAAIRAAGSVAPGLVASWALRAMTTTARRPRSDEELYFVRAGTRVEHWTQGASTPAYRYGHGSPDSPVDVMLVHGWNGSTTDFRRIIPQMIDAGFSVLTWDAEGHGTAEGDRSDPIRMMQALDSVLSRWGIPRTVVGHSLGAAVAVRTLARWHAKTKNVVVVAPAVDPLARMRAWAALGGGGAQRAVVDAVIRRTGIHPSVLSMAENATNLSGRLTIIHDHDDRTVPISETYRLAAAVSDVRMFLTRGHGHWKVLVAPEVIGAIMSAALS